MDEAKIYNICLQRVKFQITKARQRLNGSVPEDGRLILESYNTGDIADIIDILELYDLEANTQEGLSEKLDDLACTVSVLVKDKIFFDYDEKGDLGLFLALTPRVEENIGIPEAAFAAIG
jgi:hypothetical protein